MTLIRVAFFGDVVGKCGARAFAHGVKVLRDAGRADVVIVNAENRVNGSGLHIEGYKELRRAGADALTLGDHWIKDSRIVPALEDPEKPIARPANLAASAPGKTHTRIELSNGGAPLYVLTVLGRLFMSIPANSPFEAIDREVEAIASADEDALVLVEVHAEATSEKIALAHHCASTWSGRVVAVLGSHTHVQTADPRIIEPGVAAITDVGMCGGHGGVIGRKAAPVVRYMATNQPAPFPVCDDDPKACGCVLQIDTAARRATSIEPFAIPAATNGAS